MKCFHCGRPIKHPYYFKGNTLGIECWKKYALPFILLDKEQYHTKIENDRYLRNWCDIEVLKQKDLSKITSQFKLDFIPSVIAQFNDKGFLSDKQRDIITGMWNGKDWKNYWRIAVEAGLDDKQNLIDTGLMKESDFQ
uniref:Uncharacterized protein n=1 Tax=viral metagenome TaxID=1070528 RepID=A0A6M3LBS3_9ZZZZ